MIGTIWLFVAMIWGLVAIIGSAILSESDQHYQHVGLVRLTQNNVNDYTEVEIEPGKVATNSGLVIHTTSLAPSLAPNAFGKGKHGAQVWDVKEWVVKMKPLPNLISNTFAWQGWALTDDGATRTSIATPSETGFVDGDEEQTANTTGAAGEISHWGRVVNRWPQPSDIIGGTSFNNLLTAERYRIGIQSVGNTGKPQLDFGMKARRVLIPLNEVFFDRGTLANLLNMIAIEALLD